MDTAPETGPTVTCAPAAGYAPGIGRYVAQLAETRAELLRQVAGLTPSQLSWHPDDATESIGTQLLHVAAVEWSWVFEEIFRRSADDHDGWDEAFPIRFGLPQVSGQPLAYYTDRLDRVRREVLTALTELTEDDLPRLVPGSDSPDRFSIDWILFHLVHHEAHHACQVELLVRLLPRPDR